MSSRVERFELQAVAAVDGQSVRNGLSEPGAIPLLVVVCAITLVVSLLVKFALGKRKK